MIEWKESRVNWNEFLEAGEQCVRMSRAVESEESCWRATRVTVNETERGQVVPSFGLCPRDELKSRKVAATLMLKG